MKKRKNNIFNTVKMAVTPSNTFDLSHDVKMTFGMGKLIPHVLFEVVPGDKWSINTESMLRFAPLISPVMHRIEVTQHFYFVPNRILWDGWEQWITRDVVESPPTVVPEDLDLGDLGDYLGYQYAAAGVTPEQSAFPLAAYLKVWDDWYRDQNLQAERFVPLLSGNNPAIAGLLADVPFNRAWEHDYFTSCLPFAQKGDAVQIPLTVSPGQTVYLDPDTEGGTVDSAGKFVQSADHGASSVGDVTQDSAGIGLSVKVNGVGHVYDPGDTLKVDVQSDATDINSLRRAFRLQEWLERNARGGTRYIENILAHFGVRSSDARLQRSEYLGGTKSRMVISEVLANAQTYAVDELVPLGQMGGHGISVDAGNRFSYYAEEHGWIIGIINVQPVTAYQQGVRRDFVRYDPLDYYWPSFANIGEQEVLNQELFLTGNDIDQETFGYIPRYSEYKYAPSRVHGELRGTMAFWHLGRIFNSTPTLNEEFIECVPRSDIFAVEDTENQTIIAHIFVNAIARRKMPRFGVPQI